MPRPELQSSVPGGIWTQNIITLGTRRTAALGRRKRPRCGPDPDADAGAGAGADIGADADADTDEVYKVVSSWISLDIQSVPIQRTNTRDVEGLAWVPMQRHAHVHAPRERKIKKNTTTKTSTSENNLRSALQIPLSDGHDRSLLDKSGPSVPKYHTPTHYLPLTDKSSQNLTEPLRTTIKAPTSLRPCRGVPVDLAKLGVDLIVCRHNRRSTNPQVLPGNRDHLWSTQLGSNTFRRGWETS